MSDLFLNTLANLEVGGEIVYHAADPKSRDKAIDLIDKTLDIKAKQYSINIRGMGRRSKITIKREA